MRARGTTSRAGTEKEREHAVRTPLPSTLILPPEASTLLTPALLFEGCLDPHLIPVPR